jgi:Tfp pilus assembly protein PilO
MTMMALVQTTPTPPMPPMPPDMPQVVIRGSTFWDNLPPEAVVIVVLLITVGIVLMSWPIVRAVARRIEGKSQEDPVLRGEVEQLRARLAEMETLHVRLSDLEERVDFTERLLAQQRGMGQLPAH